MVKDILYKDKNMIAVCKAAGIPVQSDLSGDKDAMALVSEYLLSIGEPSALWLIHRLDRVVGGAVVFARNKGYAAKLSALASGRDMQKEYLAVVEGRCEGGILKDYLYKDSAKGKAFVVDRPRQGVKDAELEYSVIATKACARGELTLVKIRLHTGRFHQIRVQFSSRGLPIVGDGKYGSRDNGAKMPALFASSLSFCVDKRDICVKALPCLEEYPWSDFADEIKSYGEKCEK